MLKRLRDEVTRYDTESVVSWNGWMVFVGQVAFKRMRRKPLMGSMNFRTGNQLLTFENAAFPRWEVLCPEVESNERLLLLGVYVYVRRVWRVAECGVSWWLEGPQRCDSCLPWESSKISIWKTSVVLQRSEFGDVQFDDRKEEKSWGTMGSSISDARTMATVRSA